MGKSLAPRGAVEIGSAILGLGNGGRLLAGGGRQLATVEGLYARAENPAQRFGPRGAQAGT